MLYGVVDDVETEANEVGSSISLRSFLAAEWSKSGPDVSGRALSGRITRTALSAIEDLNSLDSMDLSCSVIRDKVAEQKQAHEETCTMISKFRRLTRDMMMLFQGYLSMTIMSLTVMALTVFFLYPQKGTVRRLLDRAD